MKAYIRLLKDNPSFSFLWGAQVVSLLGDWFNTIVLSTLVSRYSNGSGLAISLFLMARFVPPLFVGPFAGVLVDRFDRKKLLIYSNILRTGVVLAYLLATSPDRLWLIYALTVAQFTLSALFEPGQSAITPSLVKRDDLVAANTLASITWSTMLALGAMIGGAVAAIFGPVVALVIDAITFAVAAALIAQIQLVYEDEGNTEESSDEPPQRGFMDGLRYLTARPSTAAVLLIKGSSSIGNVDTLMTIYATVIFASLMKSELSLGIMFSAFGLGAILGPLILNIINDGSIVRMRQLVVLGFALIVAGWVILGTAASLAMVSVALMVRAMGGSANWTYSSVIIQKTVPDQYLGRVFSLDMAVFQLSTAISIIGHGLIIDFFRQQALNNWFTQIPEVIFANVSILPWRTISLAEMGLISIGTGLVSMAPLLLWGTVVLRANKRHKIAAAETKKGYSG